MGIYLYTNLGGGETYLPGVVFFPLPECTGGILSNREAEAGI